MKHNIDNYSKVPLSMKCLFGRLFGELSYVARENYKTNSQWRSALNKVLMELNKYLEENIVTDDDHMKMLKTSLASSEAHLSSEFFWPGYLEGILRFAFILLGDLPNHTRKNKGRKKIDHYNLRKFRKINYYQDTKQKLSTLYFAPHKSGIELNEDIDSARRQFHKVNNGKRSERDFLKWYKENYPKDYVKVF